MFLWRQKPTERKALKLAKRVIPIHLFLYLPSFWCFWVEGEGLNCYLPRHISPTYNIVGLISTYLIVFHMLTAKVHHNFYYLGDCLSWCEDEWQRRSCCNQRRPIRCKRAYKREWGISIILDSWFWWFFQPNFLMQIFMLTNDISY